MIMKSMPSDDEDWELPSLVAVTGLIKQIVLMLVAVVQHTLGADSVEVIIPAGRRMEMFPPRISFTVEKEKVTLTLFPATKSYP